MWATSRGVPHSSVVRFDARVGTLTLRGIVQLSLTNKKPHPSKSG